jgi:hypothetical protein
MKKMNSLLRAALLVGLFVAGVFALGTVIDHVAQDGSDIHE